MTIVLSVLLRYTCTYYDYPFGIFKLFLCTGVLKSGVQTHVVLCFCYVFLRHVYPVLPVSLDCPFLIAPLVLSNVYFPEAHT